MVPSILPEFFFFTKTLSIDFISIYNLYEGIEENLLILQQKERNLKCVLFSSKRVLLQHKAGGLFAPILPGFSLLPKGINHVKCKTYLHINQLYQDHESE